MSRRRRILVTVLVLLAVLAAGAGLAYRFIYLGPRASGPMAQGAYVWQRSWTEPVRAAVASAGRDFDRLAYLAAETNVDADGHLRVTRVQPDFAALAEAGCPVVPTLRIPRNDAPCARSAQDLATLAEGLVADARDAGLTVAEFQVDYDCPTGKLADYADWPGALKSALPVPVTITALPSWLRSDGFRTLIARTDGYVLQVHSLQRPAGARPFLVDPDAARRAVNYAGMLRAPFRVALPTYGYELTWRGDDLLDVAAEDSADPAGADQRKELVLARPDVMADLIAGWTADRPACMTGVMWFRLPHAADRRNWQPVTLRTVMAGLRPVSDVVVEVRRTEPGLADVFVVNRGSADGRYPARIVVDHAADRDAADALGAYVLETPGTNRVGFVFNAEDGRLPAGKESPVGWIRLGSDQGGRIDAYIADEPKDGQAGG